MGTQLKDWVSKDLNKIRNWHEHSNRRRLEAGVLKSHSTRLLTLRAESIIIWDDLAAKLSSTAKSDLEDSIKCLRCGIATPAAMISLRAAEDVVRKY